MRFQLLPPGVKATKRGQIWLDGDTYRIYPSNRAIVVPPIDISDRGPAGVDGAPGVPGESIVGPAGRDGRGFRFVGQWRRKARYAVNDVVFHNGGSWVALVPEPKNEPSDSSKQWGRMSAPGEDAPEESRITYTARGARGPAGTVEQVTSGFTESVAIGDVVYIAGDAMAAKASAASGEAATAVGIVTGPNTYQTSGPVECQTWNLTPGKVYYLSPTTPGGLTDIYPTAPGNFVVIVGTAITPRKLNINIHWMLQQS